MVPRKFEGGCACGAVRYEVLARPLAMFNCHCRACQLVSGAPYAPIVVVLSKAFRLTQGALKHHFLEKAAGGRHKRGFCADCGSRITGGETDEPGRWLGLAASSLDDPSWYSPAYDIFTSHAQPWDLMAAERAKHETYPPR